ALQTMAAVSRSTEATVSRCPQAAALHWTQAAVSGHSRAAALHWTQATTSALRPSWAAAVSRSQRAAPDLGPSDPLRALQRALCRWAEGARARARRAEIVRIYAQTDPIPRSGEEGQEPWRA